MGLTYEAVVRLFRLGHFSEIVSGSGTTLNRSARPEHQILVARALVYTGDVLRAETIAGALQDLPPSLQSRVEVTLGLAAKRKGDFGSASLHLQRAVLLARASREEQQEAWTKLHLFRLLAEGQPIATLTPLLGEVRQAAVRVGDPALTIYLHKTVAVIEGQTGRTESAVGHLAIAQSLLDKYPITWLQELVALTRSCLASLALDFSGAETSAIAARQYGKTTGHRNVSQVLDVNDAHAKLVCGRFPAALDALQSLRATGGAVVGFAASEGLARLYIAVHQLDLCHEILKSLRDAREAPDSRNLYSLRWLGVTSAKLLLRLGKLSELRIHIQREWSRAKEMQDTPLLGALALVAANGATAEGSLHDASLWLRRAARAGASCNPEISGQFHEANARAIGDGKNGLEAQLRSRAQRVWWHHGNVLSRVESASSVNGRMPIANYSRDSRFGSPPASATTLADEAKATAVIDCVASAFDAGATPALLAGEIEQLLTILGCREVGAVLETRDCPAATSEDEDRVVLGQSGLKTLVLSCRETADPVTNLALAGVIRVAQSAVAFERLKREERERATVWPAPSAEASDSIYVDEQMLAMLAAARRVASVNVPVLITGETGTGKEVLARAIHAASNRNKAAFVPFNCATCPPEVVDSQLFGHRRGAFTGALEHSPGVIRAAHGGTLFLDEVGDATWDVQPKLLRFLESGEIHPIGEPRPLAVDVRIIAATNVDLDEQVAAKHFREDLFYRLNIVRFHLLPLRERRVEIPVIASHYVRKYAAEFGKGNLRLAEDTMGYLLLYRWPGNIRQLANEMRRLAALAETDAVIMPEHLGADIVAARRATPAAKFPETNELIVRTDQPMAAAVEHLERTMITRALEACRGRVEDSARTLGLSRKGLYLKRQRFGLEIGPPQTPRHN